MCYYIFATIITPQLNKTFFGFLVVVLLGGVCVDVSMLGGVSFLFTSMFV